MPTKRETASKKSQYITSLFANEDAILAGVQMSIKTNDIQQINLSPAEARLVQILLKLHGTETLVEVGTLAGYSAIWAARALPENGKVFSFEKDPRVAEVAINNIMQSDVAGKIEVLVGDAHAKLAEIESRGPFDAIFIDAEKSGYCKYLDWAEKNLRQGGLVIGDNTFMFGGVYDDTLDKDSKSVKVMKEFNQRLADTGRYDGIIIPTDEGLTVAIKKF